ncbi:MAG: PAS domain-containing protein [Sulfurovaceae bacterium]|nr:PAS domain-containing protein [Sulfurovaceae bacterium]
MRYFRPLPINKEIHLNSKKIIISKTDKHGKIQYVNEYFCEVAGYEEKEVLGMPHSIVRHPDMPQAVFYLMWQSIQAGNNITAIVKNLAKSGEYYWVTTDFEILQDNKEIQGYIAYRRPASNMAISGVEELYEKLLKIEKKSGVEQSLLYLQGFLDVRHITYHELMEELVKPRSIMEKLFLVMKRTFKYTNNFNNSSNSDEKVS